MVSAGICSVTRLLWTSTTCSFLSSPPTGCELRLVAWHSCGTLTMRAPPRMQEVKSQKRKTAVAQTVNNECPGHINIVNSNDHIHTMLTQRIHHSDDDADCDSNSGNGAGVDDHSDDGRDSSDATRTADLHSSARSNAIASSQQPPCSSQPSANSEQEAASRRRRQ